jgi:hypothetical protein
MSINDEEGFDGEPFFLPPAVWFETEEGVFPESTPERREGFFQEMIMQFFKENSPLRHYRDTGGTIAAVVVTPTERIDEELRHWHAYNEQYIEWKWDWGVDCSQIVADLRYTTSYNGKSYDLIVGLLEPLLSGK